MNTNAPVSPRRLVGLCGDRREQHGLAFLMTYDGDPNRGYIEVPTRDRARDLVQSLHLDLAGIRLNDLLDNEGWLAVLANDTPEAVLADRAVEVAHAALCNAMAEGQLHSEALGQAEDLLATGNAVLVTGVDTMELAAAIHALGGVIVRLDAPTAATGIPIGAVVHPPIDLVIPMTGTGDPTSREAMSAIEQLIADRAVMAASTAA